MKAGRQPVGSVMDILVGSRSQASHSPSPFRKARTHALIWRHSRESWSWKATTTDRSLTVRPWRSEVT